MAPVIDASRRRSVNSPAPGEPRSDSVSSNAPVKRGAAGKDSGVVVLTARGANNEFIAVLPQGTSSKPSSESPGTVTNNFLSIEFPDESNPGAAASQSSSAPSATSSVAAAEQTGVSASDNALPVVNNAAVVYTTVLPVTSMVGNSVTTIGSTTVVSTSTAAPTAQPGSSSAKSNSTPLLVGGSIGGALLIALIVGLIWFMRRRSRQRKEQDTMTIPTPFNSFHGPTFPATPVPVPIPRDLEAQVVPDRTPVSIQRPPQPPVMAQRRIPVPFARPATPLSSIIATPEHPPTSVAPKEKEEGADDRSIKNPFSDPVYDAEEYDPISLSPNAADAEKTPNPPHHPPPAAASGSRTASLTSSLYNPFSDPEVAKAEGPRSTPAVGTQKKVAPQKVGHNVNRLSKESTASKAQIEFVE